MPSPFFRTVRSLRNRDRLGLTRNGYDLSTEWSLHFPHRAESSKPRPSRFESMVEAKSFGATRLKYSERFGEKSVTVTTFARHGHRGHFLNEVDPALLERREEAALTGDGHHFSEYGLHFCRTMRSPCNRDDGRGWIRNRYDFRRSPETQDCLGFLRTVRTLQ